VRLSTFGELLPGFGGFFNDGLWPSLKKMGYGDRSLRNPEEGERRNWGPPLLGNLYTRVVQKRKNFSD
jgi:hypothetical protein